MFILTDEKNNAQLIEKPMKIGGPLNSTLSPLYHTT